MRTLRTNDVLARLGPSPPKRRLHPWFGKAGGALACGLLPAADGAAGFETRQAIGAAHVMAHGLKPALHRGDIRAVHGPHIAPPPLEIAHSIGNPVAHVTDEKRVKVAHVVVLQDIEIGGHDEGGAVSACGHQQVAFAPLFMRWERFAVHPCDAHGGPAVDRATLVRAFEGAGDRGRNAHLEPPVAPLYPAVPRKVVADGGQRIHLGAPDVGAPVAIAVGGVFQEDEGMNCGCPKAPAQLLFIAPLGAWPAWAICRAAMSSCAKYSARVLMKHLVPSTSKTLCGMATRP